MYVQNNHLSLASESVLQSVTSNHFDIHVKTIVKPTIITGYNQSVTGCGSQRKHVVVTQRKLI